MSAPCAGLLVATPVGAVSAGGLTGGLGLDAADGGGVGCGGGAVVAACVPLERKKRTAGNVKDQCWDQYKGGMRLPGYSNGSRLGLAVTKAFGW